MKKNPNYKLKALRVEHRLTQTDMGNLLNISKVAYSFKENGKRDFTESEIRYICSHFKANPNDIFFNDVTDGITQYGGEK
ncbi:MAG: helix-turn-helix transcriptional regulator [Clostridiales bacterium]|nr:helix-turn-helix transcriptional regulator [Clostridiales bacterium]